MSTSYDIHCLQCGRWIDDWRDPSKKVWSGENTGLDDCRSGSDLEALLVERRADFETIGMLLGDVSKLPYDLTRSISMPLVDVLGFFGKHAGHNLEVRDEYGRSWAECVAERARWESERATQKEQHA